VAILRRPGARWRILVHRPGRNGHSWHVGSDPRDADADAGKSEHLTATTLEGTEFDELVIGQFLHLEQMDTSTWWLSIGGVTVNIRADRDGRPKHVGVSGPGDYDNPVEGCTYSLDWSADTPRLA
jgi:hypothetical protein